MTGVSDSVVSEGIVSEVPASCTASAAYTCSFPSFPGLITLWVNWRSLLIGKDWGPLLGEPLFIGVAS